MRKFLLGIVLVLTVSLLSGCFPKAYTSKEEKEQLAHAIAIARVYQKKYAPSMPPVFVYLIVGICGFSGAFLLYEIIARRKPSEEFMIRAEYVGFGILVLLMVVANLNDILRWLGYM